LLLQKNTHKYPNKEEKLWKYLRIALPTPYSAQLAVPQYYVVACSGLTYKAKENVRAFKRLKTNYLKKHSAWLQAFFFHKQLLHFFKNK
jgi:hypothetical protein